MKKKLLSVKISLIAISVVCQAFGNDVSAVKYSLPQFGHYTHHGVIQDDLPRGVDKRDAVLYLRQVENVMGRLGDGMNVSVGCSGDRPHDVAGTDHTKAITEREYNG